MPRDFFNPLVARARVGPENFRVALAVVVVKARCRPSVLASGDSTRLAESLALIWNNTRISNSVRVFRPRNRFTLL